jgi:hypothetical protein
VGVHPTGQLLPVVMALRLFGMGRTRSWCEVMRSVIQHMQHRPFFLIDIAGGIRLHYCTRKGRFSHVVLNFFMEVFLGQ